MKIDVMKYLGSELKPRVLVTFYEDGGTPSSAVFTEAGWADLRSRIDAGTVVTDVLPIPIHEEGSPA